MARQFCWFVVWFSNYFDYLFKINFYLSYTNLNNKKILEKLNKLYKTFTAIFSNSDKFVKPFCNKKRIKLGIVCNQIFNPNKPVSRDRSNIILNLDKTIYDIYIITSISRKETLEKAFKDFPKILCNLINFKNVILNNDFDIDLSYEFRQGITDKWDASVVQSEKRNDAFSFFSIGFRYNFNKIDKNKRHQKQK